MVAGYSGFHPRITDKFGTNDKATHNALNEFTDSLLKPIGHSKIITNHCLFVVTDDQCRSSPWVDSVIILRFLNSTIRNYLL